MTPLQKVFNTRRQATRRALNRLRGPQRNFCLRAAYAESRGGKKR